MYSQKFYSAKLIFAIAFAIFMIMTIPFEIGMDTRTSFSRMKV